MTERHDITASNGERPHVLVRRRGGVRLRDARMKAAAVAKSAWQQQRALPPPVTDAMQWPSLDDEAARRRKRSDEPDAGRSHRRRSTEPRPTTPEPLDHDRLADKNDNAAIVDATSNEGAREIRPDGIAVVECDVDDPDPQVVEFVKSSKAAGRVVYRYTVTARLPPDVDQAVIDDALRWLDAYCADAAYDFSGAFSRRHTRHRRRWWWTSAEGVVLHASMIVPH